MTVEDHSGDDDSKPTAEEEAAYAGWRDASKEPESAPAQVIAPMQKGPPVRKRTLLSHNDRFRAMTEPETAWFMIAAVAGQNTRRHPPSPE